MGEDPFEEIAQKCSQAAAAVDCSREEYIEGLRYIIGELQIDIEAAGMVRITEDPEG
jgi:hypothetical protein